MRGHSWVLRKDDCSAQLLNRFQAWQRENRTPMPLLCTVFKFQKPTPSGRSPNRSKIGRVRDFSLHPLFELTRVDKISFFRDDARRRNALKASQLTAHIGRDFFKATRYIFNLLVVFYLS